MNTQKLPSNLFRLIENEAFRSKIGMWIGERSLSSFYFFMNGASLLIQMNKLEEAEEELKFRQEFCQYVANYYGSEESYNWKDFILDKNDKIEEKSLEVFFDIYDKYKKDQST